MRFLRGACGDATAILPRGSRCGQGIRRMSVNFEELDFLPTAMGVLSLRRRRHPTSGVASYEIKLCYEFLMSSAFTFAEIALPRLGLAALRGSDLDVAVAC